jgi:hypothetical protein
METNIHDHIKLIQLKELKETIEEMLKADEEQYMEIRHKVGIGRDSENTMYWLGRVSSLKQVLQLFNSQSPSG